MVSKYWFSLWDHISQLCANELPKNAPNIQKSTIFHLFGAKKSIICQENSPILSKSKMSVFLGHPVQCWDFIMKMESKVLLTLRPFKPSHLSCPHQKLILLPKALKGHHHHTKGFLTEEKLRKCMSVVLRNGRLLALPCLRHFGLAQRLESRSTSSGASSCRSQ